MNEARRFGMRKIALFALAMVLVLAGCTQDPVVPKASMSIPSEFHGTWESIEVDQETGRSDVMRINSDDIISGGASIVDNLNSQIAYLWQMCQDNGIAFDFTCGGEQLKHSRWDFTYTISAGGSISMEVMSLELMDDGNLSVVFVITPNPNGGSDPLKPSKTYKRI